MNGRSFLSGLVAVSFSLLVAVAHAQQPISDADRTAARDLYVEGSQLQQQGRYADALDRFQRSLAVFPTAPTTAYRIGQCRMALGQLVEAAEMLRLVATIPLAQGANADFVKAKADAAIELASLEPRIPKLRINVVPAGVSGLSVSIDNVVVPPALVGVARPVNPGTHKVLAGAPGYSSAQAQVDVRERQQPIPEVTLTLQPGAPQNNTTYVPQNQNPPPNNGYQQPYPYNTWQPPPRRPQGATTSFMIGIDGAVSFPFGTIGPNSGGQQSLYDQYGVGGAAGIDVGFRFARIIYFGAFAQGSFFGGNGATTTGGVSFGLGAVLGFMSNPEGFGVYGELGGALRTISIDSGTELTGDIVLGFGFQFKVQSFRFIPKIDLYVGPNDGSNTHGFFTLGLAGFWELPLVKPAPPPPAENYPATAPPPSY